MKKYLITIVLSILLGVAIVAHAADGDMDQTEVKADVAEWAIDTFKILRYTETAIVTYRKNDASGNSLGETIDVVFSNREDNPETVGVDETETDFTDFYNYLHTRIRAGDSLKVAITKAVKIKLGI